MEMHNFSMPVRGNNQSRLPCLPVLHVELLVSWFPRAVDRFCGNAELSDHYTLPHLAVCSGSQTTPVAALALGSGAADPTETRNWELPQPKLLCSAFPPWPPALSCEVIQDVCPGCGMEEERESWSRIAFKRCAEQAGNANGEWKGRLVIAPPCLCVLGAGETGKRREGWCGNV